ncbi:hypothetical protein D9M68_940620 [compost metagenome]
MVDLALERFGLVCRDPQLLAGEVAKHRHGARRTHTPGLPQSRHLALAFLADEEVHHRALALEQLAHQALADEAGGTGDEVMHEGLLKQMVL